jgi:uncharacterized protein involved in high-affinity Fe2+ transport
MISKPLFTFLFFVSSFVQAELPEMIIGEESISPGIDLVFEGAIKDDVFPSSKFGSEEDSDIHIEVLANWNSNAPNGSPTNGFVAYLRISAEILNQNNLETKTIQLLPHLNLSDNLHYALNTNLPGGRDDLYTITFYIDGPEDSTLGLHFDWREEVGSYLPEVYEFIYKDLNFKEIANSSRR